VRGGHRRYAKIGRRKRQLSGVSLNSLALRGRVKVGNIRKKGIQVKASMTAQRKVFSPSLCLYHAKAIGLMTKKTNNVPHNISQLGR